MINLLSILPLFGLMIAELIWCSCNVIINRIFVLHFSLGFLIGCFIFVHLFVLHSFSSSNPLLNSCSSLMIPFGWLIVGLILTFPFLCSLWNWSWTAYYWVVIQFFVPLLGSILLLCFLMVVVQIHGFCWVLEYYSILFVFLYFFDYFLTVFLFISSSYFLSFLSFNPSSTTVYSSTQHSIFLLQLNVFLSLLTSCNFG